MKLLKRIIISNLIVVLALMLMPVYLITNDISLIETLIEMIGKSE
jgi:ABC-type glycerol-3-phosphate transport system permease component